MKKIIISDHIRQYLDFELFPETTEGEIYTAFSNEDALNLHRKKKADLIITELFGAGMNAVQFCSVIRETPELRRVSVVVYCRDNDVELKESRRCRANAVITLPIERGLLRHTVQQLLAISSRADYRVRFSARCARHSLRNPFECEAENISATGMLIQAGTELSRGDRINFSLTLPAASSFEIQAEVVRTVKSANERNRYGLRFSRLDPSAQKTIETIVNPH